MRRVVFLVFLMVAVSASTLYAQQLVINEFMASNASTLSDEDGDYEDWIELYNSEDYEVNLAGWGLSDSYALPFRWVFPDTIVGPGEFLLVWASGKDRKQGELHTNFQISSEGEPLLLVQPSGNWADMVAPVALPSDISWGRKPDGHGEWFYFDEPTPGVANSTTGYTGILSPPVFSHQSGVYPEPFDLTITHPDATIVYSTDGSAPSLDNLQGTSYQFKNSYIEKPNDPDGDLLSQSFTSHLLDQKIQIRDVSSQPDRLTGISSTWCHSPYYFPQQPVNKVKIVRARAFKPGKLPSPVVTAFYYIDPQQQMPYTLPVVLISANDDYFFDYEKGIYVAGHDFDVWREANPQEEASGSSPANYRRRGDEYEYPINLMLFDPKTGQLNLNQDAGVRIHGGWSRSFPNKSLRLYARNQYGESSFNFPVFNDQPYQSYKRLILRVSGNDFYSTLFRDAFMQKLVEHLNIEVQAYEPAVLFINGEYWGIHNFRERYDKHYLERVFGVDPENIDLLTAYMTVKEGDNVHYKETLDYIAQNDMSTPEAYAHIQTRIDVENYIDYQLSNIFFRNTDWPAGNIDFWRLRTQSYTPDAPYGHDGRWRWLLFDTDFGFGLSGGSQAYTHNTLEHASHPNSDYYSNPPWATFLFRGLLANEDFRNAFINRFADQLNTAFSVQRTHSLIDEFKELLAPEMPEHIHRWSKPDNMKNWEDRIKVMKEFGAQRPYHQRKHIIEKFDLDGLAQLKVDVSHPLHGHIKVNSIDICPSVVGVPEDPYPWTGLYFQGIPLNIEAVPAPGYTFSHWEGDLQGTQSVYTWLPEKDFSLKAVFTTTQQPTLLEYWLFDDQLPNNTPLESILPVYTASKTSGLEFTSCMPGYPYESGHPYWRVGSMERRNSPTDINYRAEGNHHLPFAEVSMRGLQVRQPMAYNGKESEMIFRLPSRGVRNLVFRFAAKDEGAASHLLLDYSYTEQTDWQELPPIYSQLPLSSQWQLYEIDLTETEHVNDNPWLKIRVRFDGPYTEAMDGNRVTFNNFSLDGEVCMALKIQATAKGKGQITPAGATNTYQCSSIEYQLIPDANHIIEDLLLDGHSVLEQVSVNEAGNGVFVLTQPVTNHDLKALFTLDPALLNEGDGYLIYPNPVQQVLYVAGKNPLKSVEICDLNGRRVWKEYFQEKNIEIHVGGIPNGLYIVRLVTSDTVVAKKILILN